MKTMKKGISVLLVFLLVFGMFAALPATVSAATDESQATSATYGDFVYQVLEVEGMQFADILKYNGNDRNVTIPETIKGLPVMGIEAQAFSMNNDMYYVSIPQNVVYIGVDAFSACENLQEVKLPYYLTALDSEAFYACTSLKTVTIPENTVMMGYAPFAACINLQEIKVVADNPAFTSIGGVLYTKDKKQLINYPCGKSGSIYKVPAPTVEIMDYAFLWNKNLTEVIIQNKCKAIGDYVFGHAQKLKMIHVPSSVTKIGANPFGTQPGATVYAERGSYAQKYCSSNGIRWTTPPVLVTGIKLNTNSLNWPVGKSGTFRATVTPSNAKNKAVSWKSSNNKVATVDANGRLTAVGVGSATITCTANDGGGAKATCTVTV